LAKRSTIQVLHRLLAEVVVDAEDLVLVEELVEQIVQVLRAGRSRPKGFSMMMRCQIFPRAVAAVVVAGFAELALAVAEAADDRVEDVRRVAM